MATVLDEDDLMESSDNESEEGDSGLQKSIFEDEYCQKFQDEKGNRRCTEEFSGWNATKALQHLTKQRKVHIQPCKARILQEFAMRYKAFTA